MRSGYIPTDADLTGALVEQQSLFRSKAVRLLPVHESRVRSEVQVAPASGSSRLDLTPVVKSRVNSLPPPMTAEPVAKAAALDSSDAFGGLAALGAGFHKPGDDLGKEDKKETASSSADEAAAAAAAAAAPPRTYDELMDEFSLHQYIIRHGKTIINTPEFESFKRKNQAIWGAVQSINKLLEDLLASYAVPFAYVDGHRVVELAEHELMKPTRQQLLGCLLNQDTVGPVIARPGQRYKGKNGLRAAVVKIQATVRMSRLRKQYALARIGVRSVVLIQSTWRTFAAGRAMRAKLAALYAERTERWEKMQKDFRENWSRFEGHDHIVVHVNSLSFDLQQRRTMPDLVIRENGQMSRLCDIAKSNVEVVYVAPYQLHDDLLQYYNKLLQIGGITHPHMRYRILYPENHARFPAHMSLSQLILYSPRCLKKLKNLVKGKRAYLQPGVVSQFERTLALELNIPMMGPDPDVADLFSTKTGAKAVFAAADVGTAPSVQMDLFSTEAIFRGLAKIVATNLDVPRWIFKIDDEFGGRGHAYFDVATLPSYESLMEEKRNSTKIWDHPTVLEAVTRQLAEDLAATVPEKVVICHPRLYRNWHQYEAVFQRVGGLIEACPQVITGSPSINLFISPDGRVTILNSHDQFFSQPYSFAGALFPQTSVPFPALRDASLAVARQLAGRGVIGFVGIDYVVFKEGNDLRLWACDINIRPTDTCNSYRFFNFALQGTFDQMTGEYRTPAGPNNTPVPRIYAMADFLNQPSLATIQYNVFFGLCRQRGITFDLQEKVGTIFNIMDNLSRGYLGVICTGDSAVTALSEICNCLSFIQNQAADIDQATKADKDSRLQAKSFRSVLSVCRSMLEQATALQQQQQ